MRFALRSTLLGVVLVVTTLATETTVRAQGAAAGAGEAAEAEAEPLTPAEGHRLRDAASNRNFLFPAAETTPQGDFEISDYELFLLTLAYGVTDRLQLSLTFFPPILADQPIFFWLSGKYAFLRTDTLVFSGLLSFNWFNSEGENALFLTIGPLLDVFFGPDGRGAVSFGISSSWLLASSDDTDELTDFDDSGFILSSAISYEVARVVKVMLELETVAALIDGDLSFANGVILTYGVRFFNDTLSGDIAFMRPIASDVDDVFILGIPFAAFTARF